MLKKISLRWRLTLLTALAIVVCCVGLSIGLNVSAYRMADSIDASVIQPAHTAEGGNIALPPVLTMPSASGEAVKQAKNSYFAESLLYTFIVVLVGGFLTYYISGKALEPVRVLNEQVKNINAHNLNESLDVPPAKDELAELTVSFNEMTDKLAKTFEAQKRFSADAAHELRTPLAVLQTKLDVFCKRNSHTTEEYEALIATFQKQTKRLRSLVTELWEIANMEHELKKQNFSVDMLLNDVVDELRLVAEEKMVEISLLSGEFEICGEYDLLYRAMFNIIENAIKYNTPGGNVKIEVWEHEKSQVAIAVRDTGVGIPDSMKKQIFEPFYRVDKSRSREMGGAGLGLALVENIVKRHNGDICVCDNNGKGSNFVVTLPKK